MVLLMSNSQRGFTFAEVIVVISMIGILAALAAPSFGKLMRDLRVSRAAMQIAEMHRTAILLSSQQTTVVSFRNDPETTFEVKEAWPDTNEPRIVGARGCNAIDWSSPKSVQSRVLHLQTSGAFALSAVRFSDPNDAPRSRVDLCFMQQHVFVRYDDGSFAPLVATTRFDVENAESKVLRKITIAPSGIPRVVR